MKRLIDILLIIMFLPLWLPLFALVWILVRVNLGSPAFFRQRRAGLHGKPFDILKFRTMTEARDTDGRLLPDAERLTPFGRRLRSLSLDELPELLNVLRGEMAMVGPRPLPVHYVERYSPGQARRLQCVPGITGWAQVNGRNALDWDTRFQHDVWYLENKSILLDIRILCMTVAAVLKREGIAGEGSVTMTEFMGSDDRPDPGHPRS
jgi:lipopolysaccharide/colanic/teichoic acid biosynthesis glycosyltransferase